MSSFAGFKEMPEGIDTYTYNQAGLHIEEPVQNVVYTSSTTRVTRVTV